MWKEFKKFAMRGNVIDLAVGIIIGGAFNNIVSSLVKDIITPLIGILLGKIDLKDRVWTIGSVNVTYGVFLQNVLDFLIISFSVFIMVKAINKLSNLRKAEEEKAEENKQISKEEQLLSEIRDLLAANIIKKDKSIFTDAFSLLCEAFQYVVYYPLNMALILAKILHFYKIPINITGLIF